MLEHLKLMHSLNKALQPLQSPTSFHSVISLYANITAMNQEDELNEGISGFSVYSLMSSSVGRNLMSKISASLWNSYACKLALTKYNSSVRGFCTQMSIDLSEPHSSVIKSFFLMSYLHLFV